MCVFEPYTLFIQKTRKMTNPIQNNQDSGIPLKDKMHRVADWISALLGDGKQGGKNSIAVLDGVRAVAIIMVIIFHVNRVTGDNLWNQQSNPLASSISTAGGTGVTLFFVLSGFLLFMPYAKALLFKTSWPLARVFYLRRILRIIPAYYVSLFLIIAFFHPEYFHKDHLQDLVLFLTFFMDSSHQTFRMLNGPYWTLATEWQFYMVLPLIALGIAFLVQRVSQEKRLKAVAFCLLGIIAGGLFVRYWGIYFAANLTQTYLIPRSLLNRILFFTYGITGKYTEDFAIGMLISLCFVYAQRPDAGGKLLAKGRRLSSWLWGGGILLLVFSYMWHFNHESHGWPFLNGLLPYYDWLSDILIAIGYGACIAAILFGPASLKRPFEFRYLRWIGLISYSLYIGHLPLLILLMNHLSTYFPGMNRYSIYGIYWLWVLLIIVPIAVLSYVLIEKPWMNLGDNLRRKIEKRHHNTATKSEDVMQLVPIHTATGAVRPGITPSSGVEEEGSVSR